MSKTPVHRWALASLTTAVCAGALTLTAAPSAPAAPPGSSHTTASTTAHRQSVAAAPAVTRAEVLQRAKSWLTANNGRPVPYSQNAYWKDGYRQDCSGYVSMALRLPAPGPNTVKLKSRTYSRQIAMKDLAPGDLVIKADSDSADFRHVVIFDGWADGAHTAYKSYEQAGVVGTRWKQHSYGVSGRDGYHAYRPVNITG
ncbi:hypothetical protein ACSNOK_21750 [Streptomyces sp. URMC 126]|uniref:hypothetical protein n=1 Tax=Streptomyces sp. URMC 126 TaxID=3423401 RepID=UPI003F1D00F5